MAKVLEFQYLNTFKSIGISESLSQKIFANLHRRNLTCHPTTCITYLLPHTSPPPLFHTVSCNIIEGDHWGSPYLPGNPCYAPNSRTSFKHLGLSEFTFISLKNPCLLTSVPCIGTCALCLESLPSVGLPEDFYWVFRPQLKSYLKVKVKPFWSSSLTLSNRK